MSRRSCPRLLRRAPAFSGCGTGRTAPGASPGAPGSEPPGRSCGAGLQLAVRPGRTSESRSSSRCTKTLAVERIHRGQRQRDGQAAARTVRNATTAHESAPGPDGEHRVDDRILLAVVASRRPTSRAPRRCRGLQQERPHLARPVRRLVVVEGSASWSSVGRRITTRAREANSLNPPASAMRSSTVRRLLSSSGRRSHLADHRHLSCAPHGR